MHRLYIHIIALEFQKLIYHARLLLRVMINENGVNYGLTRDTQKLVHTILTDQSNSSARISRIRIKYL